MNLKELKRKRASLADQIGQLSKDLEALDRVIAMYANAASSASDRLEKGVTLVNQFNAVTPETTKPVSTNGGGSFNLAKAIREAVSQFNDGFTKTHIVRRLREAHPEQAGLVKDALVSAYLWKMANRKGLIEVEKTGEGNTPNVYRKKNP